MSKVETSVILKNLRREEDNRAPNAGARIVTLAPNKEAITRFSDYIAPGVRLEIERVIKEQQEERARKIAIGEAREALKRRLGMNHDNAFAFIGIYGYGIVSNLVNWFENIPVSICYHQITLMALDAIAKKRYGYIDIRLPDLPFVGDWEKTLKAIIFICESFAPDINFGISVSCGDAEAEKAEA